MREIPVVLRFFAVAIALILVATWAIATVPPTDRGGWVGLTICSETKRPQDHEALLARLASTGEIWVRDTAIIGVQAKPGMPGCIVVTSASKTLLVRGDVDDLVGKLQ